MVNRYWYIQPISQFLFYSERLKVTETHSQFESLSNTLDEALAKRAATHHAKTSEFGEAQNALSALGTCFAFTSLDYVASINIAHARKDHMILEAVSCMNF